MGKIPLLPFEGIEAVLVRNPVTEAWPSSRRRPKKWNEPERGERGMKGKTMLLMILVALVVVVALVIMNKGKSEIPPPPEEAAVVEMGTTGS